MEREAFARLEGQLLIPRLPLIPEPLQEPWLEPGLFAKREEELLTKLQS